MREGAVGARAIDRTSPLSRGRVQTTLQPLAALLARPSVRWTLLVALVWRIVVALDGVISYYVLTPCACRQASMLRDAGWSANPLSIALDAMYRGDAPFYVALARDGYHYSTQHTSTMGFFPLLSLVVRAVSLLVGNVYIAAAIVPTACFFLAAALLAVLLEERGLGKRAPLIVAFLLCFPFSLFYAAIYTEPLYLLLVLAAVLSLERRKWYTAALCAALIALTRPTGAFVIAPTLAVMAAGDSIRDWRAYLSIPAAALALAGFMIYQWWKFGTPLAYVHAKSVPGWAVSPQRLLADFTLHGAAGRSTALLALMMAIALLFLASVPLVWRRFGPGYATYCFLCVAVSLSVGLPGMDRYVIVAFPSFAAVGMQKRAVVVFGLVFLGFYGLLVTVSMFQKGLSVT